MNHLGVLTASEESVTALRTLLFAAGLLAAALWDRARPGLAVIVLTLAGAASLAYWLVQVSIPLGLGAEPALTAMWAQTGINASLGRSDLGFVWGTEPVVSMAAALAAMGLPREAAFRLPQLGPFVALGLLVLTPIMVMRRRISGLFAAGLALGGGLWPGHSVLDAAMGPGFTAGALVAGLVVVGLSTRPRLRRLRRGHAFSLALTLVAMGALLSTHSSESAWAGAGAAMLAGATMAMAPWFRAGARDRLGAGPARRAEAVVLVMAFAGSGLFWWDPLRTVPGFIDSREPDVAIMRPLSWLSANVNRGEVILVSRTYGSLVAAHSGHRVLFLLRPGEADEVAVPEPARRARFNRSVLEGHPLGRLAEHYSVTHLLLGPGEAEPAGIGSAASSTEPTLGMNLVYQDAEDFRVFRFTKK